MKIARTVEELRTALGEKKEIGFVPTMGFLHAGHLSLMRRARSECETVVVSIFVNPTQFGPNEDLEAYPRDEANDLALCEKEGVDLVFLPTPDVIYPKDYATYVTVEGMSEKLCGASRPGHFRGVCTVVAKLFGMIQPQRAYFGLKDAQQFLILRRMVKDLNMPIQMIGCPTVREEDGLALSSRNVYLTPEERAIAPTLRRALLEGEAMILSGNRHTTREVIERLEEFIDIEGRGKFTIDYISLVDLETLEDKQHADSPCLLALAAKLGRARLIDNIILGLKDA